MSTDQLTSAHLCPRSATRLDCWLMAHGRNLAPGAVKVYAAHLPSFPLILRVFFPLRTFKFITLSGMDARLQIQVTVCPRRVSASIFRDSATDSMGLSGVDSNCARICFYEVCTFRAGLGIPVTQHLWQIQETLGA